MNQTKVLMVCLGNICRSPLAEGILKSKLNTDNFEVDSAGTSATHAGELPDSRSIKVAQQNQIDISNQRSRPFNKSDFDEFDLIYVMDQQNYSNVVSLAKTEEHRKKVSLILNTIHPKTDAEVPDPYYGGQNGFKNVFSMLNEACKEIANQLQNNGDA